MIRLANVTKEYKTATGKIRAIDDLSLVIERGDRIGVMGNNGSGKSTLIRLVGGVELPTSGRVERDMTVSWPLAFKGGFQNNLSGYENIRFIARIYQRPFDELADAVADFSELGERLKDPLYTYSSGMRAKISFGLSLAVEFDCYLIDEIIAVGDKQFRKKCRQELLEKRKDRTLLLVSHQPAVIQQYCGIALYLQDGKCVDAFDIADKPGWRKYVQAGVR